MTAASPDLAKAISAAPDLATPDAIDAARAGDIAALAEAIQTSTSLARFGIPSNENASNASIASKSEGRRMAKEEYVTPPPTPEAILAAREAVQKKLDFAANGAKEWCAAATHSVRRSWERWEAGDRQMHPAFWELLTIKIREIGIKPPRSDL